LSEEHPDVDFDDALFDLLVQACSVHACKDCTKDKCEVCICLKTMHSTLPAFGFGANLCRGAPLWVLLFCCLTIKKFQLDKTTGVTNGKNFVRIYSKASAKKHDQIYESWPDDVVDTTIRRIKRLVTIVDHIVSSRSNLSCLKDVSPLLPLEYYFEKEKVIQSIGSQFEQQIEAVNSWICCKQDNVCFVLKICKGVIDIANVHYYLNITNHKWFETSFKSSLLFLGALEQPVKSAKKLQRDCSVVSASKKPKLAASSQVQQADDDNDIDSWEFDLSEDEQTRFEELNKKELLGIKPAKYWTTMFCIRQLKLEQDSLWESIEMQRHYVRKIETLVIRDMAKHNLYFEYLSASPTPAPKFLSPASVETLTAIAMMLTVKKPISATAMFPFPEGSLLATLSPHLENNVVKSSSKLSIGLGRVRCNHCHKILVADSFSKHMMRKHSGILPKKTPAASVMPKQFRDKHMMRKHSGILPKKTPAASVMPKQFRDLFSKVRRQSSIILIICRCAISAVIVILIFSFQLQHDLAEYSSDVRLMRDM
jgi:hypothetical protein